MNKNSFSIGGIRWTRLGNVSNWRSSNFNQIIISSWMSHSLSCQHILICFNFRIPIRISLMRTCEVFAFVSVNSLHSNPCEFVPFFGDKNYFNSKWQLRFNWNRFLCQVAALRLKWISRISLMFVFWFWLDFEWKRSRRFIYIKYFAQCTVYVNVSFGFVLLSWKIPRISFDRIL